MGVFDDVVGLFFLTWTCLIFFLSQAHVSKQPGPLLVHEPVVFPHVAVGTFAQNTETGTIAAVDGQWATITPARVDVGSFFTLEFEPVHDVVRTG